MEPVTNARQQFLTRQLTGFEHEIRDADLRHALVGADGASRRLTVRSPRCVGVVKIALENARRDQLVAPGGHALAVERPAGEALREAVRRGCRARPAAPPAPQPAG